jgi:uncharacterized protein YfdQ (DUF2303 family)
MTAHHDPTPDGGATVYNDVDAIARMIHAAGEPHRIDDGQTEHVSHWVIPDGHHVETVDTTRSQPHPTRKAGTVEVSDPDSFQLYVDMHAADGAAIFGDLRAGQPTITAVLNGHEPGGDTAGWGDHRVVWRLTEHKTFQLWVQNNGRLFGQEGFAKFLDDNAGDIVEADVRVGAEDITTPSALEMREIAETLEARKSVDFKQATRLHDGNVQLRYEETTQASAGRAGELTVPQVFAIAVPVYEGQDPWRIEARFRYRVTKEGLTVSYHLERLHDVIEAAFRRAWESVSIADIPALLGKAPQPA